MMVKLKVLEEHRNEFGDQRAKVTGDCYEAPADAAQGLIANGYCEEDEQAATAEHD